MSKVSPYQLGATIYMPSTREDLFEFVCNNKIPNLKSMVICLEDSILENEVEKGLKNISELLIKLDKNIKKPLVFVRPRNPQNAVVLYKFKNIEKIGGFVLPKFDNDSFSDWLNVINLSPKNFVFMPTLETADVLNTDSVINLKNKIIDNNLFEKILVLRIGGNDILSCLRLRRNKENTLYETPLDYIVSMFVSIFNSSGFYLTSPVYEDFKDHDILKEEFKLDLQHGLVGKTVIHPTQIEYIHELLKVKKTDYESAVLILDKNSKAVFQFNGAMCEPSTHTHWATEILERYKYYGLK